MVLAEVQDLTAYSNPAVTDKINAEMVIFSYGIKISYMPAESVYDNPFLFSISVF